MLRNMTDETDQDVQELWDEYDLALIIFHDDRRVPFAAEILDGSREQLRRVEGKLRKRGLTPITSEDHAVIKAGVGRYPFPGPDELRPLRTTRSTSGEVRD